jgi:hypothetical protein
MDTRSLIELCAREYYKADNTRKGESNSELWLRTSSNDA